MAGDENKCGGFLMCQAWFTRRSFRGERGTGHKRVPFSRCTRDGPTLPLNVRYSCLFCKPYAGSLLIVNGEIRANSKSGEYRLLIFAAVFLFLPELTGVLEFACPYDIMDELHWITSAEQLQLFLEDGTTSPVSRAGPTRAGASDRHRSIRRLSRRCTGTGRTYPGWG